MTEPERHPALDALAQAEVPDAVQARIVAGAQARVSRRAPRWPWVAALAAAGAAAGVWVAQAPAPAHAPPGHQVLAEAGAQWRVVERLGRGQRVALTAGAAEFVVQPLTGGDAFIVDTAQARVRVVGTRFRVAVQGECTAISVSEGVVQVSRPDGAEPSQLTAGDTRRVCPVAPPQPTAPPSEAPPSVAPPADPPGQVWVQTALGLIGAGQEPAKARALMERYLAEHPQGVFAQEALYYAARLALEAGDRATALARGRAFVRRFPDSHRTAWLRARLPELSR